MIGKLNNISGINSIEANPLSFLTYQESDEQGTRCESTVKAFVWGLNDKDQLGGVKGSKVKYPTYSFEISRLNPTAVCCGSKSIFILSNDGKIFACGEGANGRLGLGHTGNISQPKVIATLSSQVVKKVAVHPGGRHCLALTAEGKVYVWGEGEDGKLGLGSKVTALSPKLVETLKNKRMRDVACGSSHSAAISSTGELFTWGMGEYGR